MSDYDSGYMDGKAVMYERIVELETALADATQERDENLQALSNTIDFANKTLRQIREATRKEIDK